MDELPAIDKCQNCGDSEVKCNQVSKLQWRVICRGCNELGETRNNAIDAIAIWNDPTTLVSEPEVEGMCPNGCGLLVKRSVSFESCPVCNFERMILFRVV